MLLEVAEIVLGVFGFDRSIYGDSAKKKNRKWWYELNEERVRTKDRENIDFGLPRFTCKYRTNTC